MQIPIYRDHDEIYRADSCGPLAAAAASGSLGLHALSHGHYPGRPFPPSALPGLKMIGYWDAHEDQDWGLPWHFNEGVEITLLETGSLEFAVDGREHLLTPDSLTVARPWQRHRVGKPNVTVSRLHWLILDVGVRRPNQEWKWPSWLLLSQPDIEELTNILRHSETCVHRALPGFRECFLQVSSAVENDRGGSGLSRIAIGINDLLFRLLDTFRNKRLKLDHTLSSSRRTVELFLKDLRTNPEHLAIDWSVEEMASSCGLRTTQFVHHIRCLTNMSPNDFLNHSRLTHATFLLRNHPEMNITDIALESGFSSSQYFATVFGRRFGCTPTQFRAKAGSCPEPQMRS
jgi:AraC-like DNA-binding protein